LPIYTYQCQTCDDDVVEKRQSYSDAPLTTCQACGGELRKMLHPVGIVFKGSGFYNTDYRGGNGTAKKDGAAESETNVEATATSTSADSTNSAKSDSDSAGSAVKPEAATAATKAD